MNNNPHITRDGVEVKPGQIWRDLDKRHEGRLCKVVAIEDRKYGSGLRRKTVTVALMRFCQSNGYEPNIRCNAVQIARMHKHSTGWELVK